LFREITEILRISYDKKLGLTSHRHRTCYWTVLPIAVCSESRSKL